MFNTVILFLNIGTPELILIMFVALLLFGGEKLPGLARGLGKGIRDFKDASEGVKRELNNQINSFEEKRTENNVVTPQEEQDYNQHDYSHHDYDHTTEAENAETKPLIDTTPVEGSMPVGGHAETHHEPAHQENHAEGVHVHTTDESSDNTTHKQ